jgi:uncharacterized protein YndB with AHSA1/START domain
MIECENTIDIARAPAEVFAFIDDAARMPSWITSCIALEQTSPPPRRLGSTLHYTFKQGARPGTMDGSVTEYQPPRRLAMRFGDAGFTVTVAFRVEPAGGGARVTQSLQIEPRTLFGRLMTPLIRAGTRRQLAGDNARLKSLLTNPPPQGDPS